MHSSSRHMRPLALPRRAAAVRILLAAAAAALWVAGSIGVASAQYVTPDPPVAGAPTDVQTSPVVDAANPSGGDAGSVAGAGDATAQVATRSSGSGLPVTGGDVVGLTAIGVSAIAAGGLVLHARRRAARS